MKAQPLAPRHLRYRGHYKAYLWGALLFGIVLSLFWSSRVWSLGFGATYDLYFTEIVFSLLFYSSLFVSYFAFFKPRFNRSVQVYEKHILIHKNGRIEEIKFSDMASCGIVCWSLFYVLMKNGQKHYFNSSLERADYIWEGIYRERPELFTPEGFESFRVKLVQYDHHQKRKEWFFRHKILDVFNWVGLPFVFMTGAYLIQSQDIVINQFGLYFFRLFMFSLLAVLVVTFFYTTVLKKLIFDKQVAQNLASSESKIRDIEFEGVLLQKSKVFQIITTCFVLSLFVKLDLNLFSVSKVREDLALFQMKKGTTVVVDNRYNCFSCKYSINDGDYVVFGRGHIGQIMAQEGDMVGQVSQDSTGRMIASENIQEVPEGHVALRAGNGTDIVFVQLADLIGKVQK